MPESTHLGRAQLQVSHLERSISYYRDVLGLRVLRSDALTASLGPYDTDTVLVELKERGGARAVPRGGLLGLYHFAILLPDRPALGRFVRHLLALGLKFGSADHFVSESTYLWDSDGLGIEVYADRPPDTWRTNGREVIMGTKRLILRSVMQAGGDQKWTGMPAGARLGHMHLSVGNLATAREFYHSALGFDAVVWSYPGALFLSAGGYHHHLGTNTWAAGARAATDNDARLLEWELVVPSASDVEGAIASVRGAGYDAASGAIVADPWGTNLRLRTTENVRASGHL